MLVFRKNGERRVGTVVGSIGGGLLVEYYADNRLARSLVQMREAENQDEFRVLWRQWSQAATLPWQTEDGPVAADDLLL